MAQRELGPRHITKFRKQGVYSSCTYDSLNYMKHAKDELLIITKEINKVINTDIKNTYNSINNNIV